MSILYNPKHLYNLNTIDIDTSLNRDNRITNYFWHRNDLLMDKLYTILEKNDISMNIIDIGCSDRDRQFKKATHLLDFNQLPSLDKIIIKLDLDFDKFEYSDKYFNFSYCRHTLEDIQNPQNAFNEITRISKIGFIETPSPLVEIMNNVDGCNISCKGYIHHRYIVWTDKNTNTLKFLPKYPIIEYFKIDENLIKEYNYLLNNYAVYWNNYYIWNNNNKPNIIVYRNDINFNIIKDYANLVNEAIIASIENTNDFIKYINTI